jgi:Asp-tRNA(Asn)/Glu-tRNA(Gln) amidotransferase A subunit family amidase
MVSRQSVKQLSAAISSGSLDPISATEDCLTRIAELDGAINAFVWVDEAGALAAARALSQELSDGHRRGALHGIPIAVKELIDVAGAPAEYGSEIGKGNVTHVDAEVVSRLRRAGAVIVGTTRSHEFGWGITTQHAVRGGTRNPNALNHVPGGSSGGAGAAVAAGMVPASLATDTGGSIRIPSAFCGVAGIKPTFGRVVRTGVVPMAPSFDTVGVIASYVEDLWPILHEISGRYPGDSWQPLAPLPDVAPRYLRSLSGLRVGTRRRSSRKPLEHRGWSSTKGRCRSPRTLARSSSSWSPRPPRICARSSRSSRAARPWTPTAACWDITRNAPPRTGQMSGND